MNHVKPNLQVHIHKVDGSTTTFIQDDAREIRSIVDGFQPAQIFNRDRIAFSDKNSITTLPVSKITRIDLVSERLPELKLPIGVADAAELTWTEFQTLIRSPVIREQWEPTSTQGASVVTFLDTEMADGQRLFLTIETQVELLQSELWTARRFVFNGSGLCFRMRSGGVAVLNLAHLTRLTFFPKPLQVPADVWCAEQFNEWQPAKHVDNDNSSAPVIRNPSPASRFPIDRHMNFQRK